MYWCVRFVRVYASRIDERQGEEGDSLDDCNGAGLGFRRGVLVREGDGRDVAWYDIVRCLLLG